MTEAVAGWYPDPAGSPAHRWWDGARWTDQLQPADPAAGARQGLPAYAQPAGGQPPYGQLPYGQLPYGQPAYGMPARPSSGWQRNQMSYITMIIAAAYLVIALTANVVFIGILPVLMTVRAFNRKEKLAPVAAVCAGIAVLVSLLALASH